MKWQGVVKRRGVMASGEKGFLEVGTEVYPLGELPAEEGVTKVTIYPREEAERLEREVARYQEAEREVKFVAGLLADVHGKVYDLWTTRCPGFSAEHPLMAELVGLVGSQKDEIDERTRAALSRPEVKQALRDVLEERFPEEYARLLEIEAEGGEPETGGGG